MENDPLPPIYRNPAVVIVIHDAPLPTFELKINGISAAIKVGQGFNQQEMEEAYKKHGQV